jgi:hypothetical protein
MIRTAIVKPTQTAFVLVRGMSSNIDAGKHMPDDLKKNSEAKIRAWIEENNKNSNSQQTSSQETSCQPTSCQPTSCQPTSCHQTPSQRPPAQPTSYQSPYGYATPQSKNDGSSCTIL